METSKFKKGKTRNKKKSMGERKLFIPWKIVTIQMEVKLNKLKFYLWVYIIKPQNSDLDV